MSVDTFLLESGFTLSILQQIDLHQDCDVMSCIWRSKPCWPLLWVWAIVNSCSFPHFCSVILYFGLFLFYKTGWSFPRVWFFLISPGALNYFLSSLQWCTQLSPLCEWKEVCRTSWCVHLAAQPLWDITWINIGDKMFFFSNHDHISNLDYVFFNLCSLPPFPSLCFLPRYSLRHCKCLVPISLVVTNFIDFCIKVVGSQWYV